MRTDNQNYSVKYYLFYINALAYVKCSNETCLMQLLCSDSKIRFKFTANLNF